MSDEGKRTTSQTESIPAIKTSLPIKVLFQWTAPGRPFKQRAKIFYVNAILIVLFLEIILFFFHEYMLMLVIVSFLFVTYALNSVPPKNFVYKITQGGITIEDHFFLWQELYDFYFKKRFDSIEVLHVRTKSFLPGEITLTIQEKDKEHIASILKHYLPYREVITATFVDKSANWLTKNFPLEERSKSKKPTKVAS